MKTIAATKARETLYRLLDEVAVTSEPIQITDNGTVQALTQLDHSIFDNGATGGRLLLVTNNDNTVTLDTVQFYDTNSDLTYNVETVSATAQITIDPYDSMGFGGEANENDNGGGTVTPGFIVWGATTPVSLRRFDGWRDYAAPFPEPAPVAAPRTWLVRVGWRCRGRLAARQDAASGRTAREPYDRSSPSFLVGRGENATDN